jgi:hypothetical protein
MVDGFDSEKVRFSSRLPSAIRELLVNSQHAGSSTLIPGTNPLAAQG